ncbi:MAG: hypothetical protein IJP17_06410, partial [Clostridia bacterium]|nr:hypothetical protein [Clostridia bacterium]
SVIVTPTGKEDSIGIDSITVSVGDGGAVVIPIIIYNNAPVVDSASLSQTLLHTPSRTGSAAGRIIATDADGDSIRFALTDSQGCSVLLTPNGSYMVRIDDDFSGDTASFSFTASDGRITSDPITISFALENHLVDIEKLSQRFVCYSGEDGFYTLDLPSVDDDGDPLTWEVISTLTDNITNSGSQIILSDDRSVVKYRIDPSVNKDFTEVIELVCTDGWLQSQTIQLTCNVSANKPPVAAAGNTATTTLADAMAVCSVRISDDCPFDKCVISGIEEVIGGTVTDGEGWDNLQFTFVPDGSEAECVVRVIVKDTLSGATSVIKYVIVVE